jgi:hypothetical protein
MRVSIQNNDEEARETLGVELTGSDALPLQRSRGRSYGSASTMMEEGWTSMSHARVHSSSPSDSDGC